VPGPGGQATDGAVMPRDRERAADEIRRRAASLALAAVERQYREDLELAERWGDRGFRTSVRDAQHVLATLAEAVALGDPDAFCRELLWLRRVLTAHAVPSRILERHLAVLAELLADELSAGAAAAAGEVLSRGRAALAQRAEPGAGS
jgi:hypothetical protein